ncbi:hypothetical protein L226DRAFT_98722 [Lentinus tigrinus ALCF2SS1-7]|uniref:Uncharacterized protein n=1 Tax=Lentinus tigrinus ALCF2SS1-6 TaxID=1328759 RepID=A0A5C2RR93_9APHY|nr:hypothetical protein L227DRAFT_369472 [Lentinus tigrinus ALCF2SS1-6]RPD73827.1 hypothetical protein L226DRAFT_98722 [Lentinus tigrinus ALCF2SS1-7]
MNAQCPEGRGGEKRGRRGRNGYTYAYSRSISISTRSTCARSSSSARGLTILACAHQRNIYHPSESLCTSTSLLHSALPVLVAVTVHPYPSPPL